MNDRGGEVCPPLAELLRLSEGEATTRERRRLSTHLWRCEPCRNRLNEAELLAVECAETLACPPSIVDQTAREFVEGLHRHRRSVEEAHPGRGLTWLSMAAAVTALVLGIALSQSQTTIVRADELLDRAVQFQAHSSAVSGRAYMRWAPERHDVASIATHGDALPSDALGWVVGDSQAGDDAAARMLREHGIDARAPLDVDAIRAWRRTLKTAHERVSVVDGRIALQVQTRESAITSMELVVRAETFEPVRGTFVIAGAGRLDVELVHDSSLPNALAARSGTAAAAGASRTISATPSRDILEQVELDVRHALHATRLDLGEALAVSIRQNRVMVNGAASTTEQRALRGKLPRQRHLELDLRARSNSTAGRDERSAPPPTPPILAWLDRTYGREGGDARATFLSDLARDTRIVAERLDALAELKRRYPPAGIAAMSARARSSLQSLLNVHYRDLNAALEQLASRTAVLRGASPDLPVALTMAPSDWSSRVEPALAAAVNLQQLLPSLANADDDSELDTSREAFGRGLERIWNQLNGPNSVRRHP